MQVLSIPSPSISKIALVQQSDEELILLLNGREASKVFEQLFYRHYEILCRKVMTVVHCEQAAEEIVSDVFLKIWKNRAQLTITTKLKYYLKTAVRNQAIDYLRRQARERNFKGEIDRDYESNYTSPYEEVVGQELSQKVEAAIESLPPKGKHIFRLSRDRGMKYREIADLLNISIKTVETHMRRSLIHLRKRVQEEVN
ncbi:MAG: RNA polymerase sigma-70 factor [Bacteroidota bacterium]